MEKAYMIRNDGKQFPVLQHPYGNIDEITETLYAGEWLYDHTQHASTKQKFIDLIANYAAFYEGLNSPNTVISDLKGVIAGYPYKYLSMGFVDARTDEIEEAFTKALLAGSKAEMKALMKDIVQELNQEFLRARYGGLYNTDSSSREMVFRVSSTGFNWYNIIWKFVYDNEKSIDTVTIVRDEEATGVQNEFYRAKDGRLYDRYPVADFIMEKGNPVVETKDPVKNLLQKGRPLSELKDLLMNRERIVYRYKALVQQENKCRNFWLEDLNV